MKIWSYVRFVKRSKEEKLFSPAQNNETNPSHKFREYP